MIRMRISRYYLDKKLRKYILWDSVTVADKAPKKLTYFYTDDYNLKCKDVIKILK